MSNLKSIAEELGEVEEGAAVSETIQNEPQKSGFKLDFDFLGIIKRPTGAGEIEDYLNHPLNRSKHLGMAQMLRGLTGILGTIDSWLLDVGLGYMSFTKDRGVQTYDNGDPNGQNIIH